MWAKVDDGWWCHPKVLGLSLAARGLWISSLSWSCAQRRDTVPGSLVAMLGAQPDHAAELVAAGLWDDLDGDFRIHDWHEYQDMPLSERRAEAGRRGGQRSGEARRSKAKQTSGVTCDDSKQAEANAEATKPGFVSNCEANAEAGTHPGPSRPDPAQVEHSLVPADGAAPAVPDSEYPADFVEWWECYPRKVGKAKAAKEYRKARKRSTRAGLLAAVEAHAEAWKANRTDDQFIPHPSTWLSQGRYEDPPPAITGPPKPATRAGENARILEASLERMEGRR